jgi:hypothetical protein
MSLKLLAVDQDDLAVLSAVTQDALVPVGELVFAADEKKFYAALNRFCWEDKTPPYQRTHSALCIENVERVQVRHVDLKRPGQVLDLLTIAYEEEWVRLSFAGYRDLRLKVDGLSCRLNDFGERWTTKSKPGHGAEEWAEWAKV